MKPPISTVALSLAASVALLFGQPARADEAPLHLQTYRADAKSFHVTSVLVSGKSDAVLIDAQFTRADAHRLVAEVLASGKRLKLVYVSQGDPDYYFGLEVIHQAFPDARIVASPATAAHIRESLPEKMKVWGPKLGANGPTQPIVPEALKGDRIELEGQSLQIVGLDSPGGFYSFVWIPSIKAVVGGVRVFGDMHLWTSDSASPAERRCWAQDLRRIEALAPTTVVSGHAKPGAADDLSAVRFSLGYLDAYSEELSKAGDSTALINAMKRRYPQAAGDDVLALGAKVNKGEMKWDAVTVCR